MPSEHGRLLTAAQAAERLGLAPQTLARWRSQRAEGPRWRKVSSRVMYDEAEIERWLAEHAPLRDSTADKPQP